MKELLKYIGGMALGIIIFLAILLIGLFLLKGSLWFSENIFPWVGIVFWITIAIDVIVLLPLSIIKCTRDVGLTGLFISSYVFGLLLWVWSFLIVYSTWGWIGVIIGSLIAGFGIVPLAIIILILNAQWVGVLELVIYIVIIFGVRVLSSILLEKYEGSYEE